MIFVSCDRCQTGYIIDIGIQLKNKSSCAVIRIIYPSERCRAVTGLRRSYGPCLVHLGTEPAVATRKAQVIWGRYGQCEDGGGQVRVHRSSVSRDRHFRSRRFRYISIFLHRLILKKIPLQGRRQFFMISVSLESFHNFKDLTYFKIFESVGCT